MSNDTMLYKAPGPHEIHGGHFDYVIVDELEVEEMLEQGWSLTTAEAKELREAVEREVAQIKDAALLQALPEPSVSNDPSNEVEDDAPPTRAELEAKATELGVEFSPRIGDTKLAERIADALAKG